MPPKLRIRSQKNTKSTQQHPLEEEDLHSSPGQSKTSTEEQPEDPVTQESPSKTIYLENDADSEEELPFEYQRGLSRGEPSTSRAETTNEYVPQLMEQMLNFQKEMMTTFLTKMTEMQVTRPRSPTVPIVVRTEKTEKIKFPEFDAEKINPRAWLRNADLLMSERQNDPTATLVQALLNSLKGKAATEWLSEIIDREITWERFRGLFEREFCRRDTAAATIHKILNTAPKGDLLKYAKSHLVKLRGATDGLTKDEILILIIASLVAKGEDDLRKFIYKQKKIDEDSLMEEIVAATSYKQPGGKQDNSTTPQGTNSGKGPTQQSKGQGQKRPASGETSTFSTKKAKFTPGKKFGGNQQKWAKSPDDSTIKKEPVQKIPICSYCHKTGHHKDRCFRNPSSPNYNGKTQKTTTGGQSQKERKVNICSVNPKGMLVALVVIVVAMVAGGCKISELQCRNGRCVGLDLYCNGNNDCGDNSDEPKYCTVCNRTYYGDVDRTYAMSIRAPRESSIPFLCHLTFTANGHDNGDIVQLLFDAFSIGRLTDKGCSDGYMQVTELGRPLTEGGWCGEATTPSVYFSESSTITLSLRLIHNSPLKLNMRYKFLGEIEAITRLGSVEAPIERGVHVPGSYCSRTFDECYRKKCQVQSPNFPGLYPRNVTCYYQIRQKAVPTCKHAMIQIKDNYVRLKRSVPLAGLNKTTVYTRTDCSPTEDQLLFYDGVSESDTLLTRYCGGGLLPHIVARAPTMLVVFKSSPYAVPSREGNKPLHGFSLRVNVIYSDSDSLDFAKSSKCEFLVNGTAKRRGEVLSPRHTLAPNTTCWYRFHGLPTDKIWLYFDSYTVFHNPNCTTRLRVYDQTQVLEDTCEAPRLCDHSSLRNASRETRPCKKQESYITPTGRLSIEHKSTEGTALKPSSFKFHYEFVDTRLGGESWKGGPCHRLFRKKKSGMVHSPKNVFMYGRGGATNLTCVYRIEAGEGERVRLSIHNASFGEPGCRTIADSHTSRPICVRGNRAVELTVWDLPWKDISLQRACYCDNSVISMNTSSSATFLSSGRTLQLSFAVSSFNVSEDFSQIYFHATYTIIRWSECSRAQRVRGSGGEIKLVFPAREKEDMYCEEMPWLVEANFNKSLFLATWGHFLPLDAPSDSCETTNRVLLYTGSPLRLMRVVCPSMEKEKEFAVHVFSEEWFGGGGVWSAKPPSFLVEFVGREAGGAHLNWLEISKSKSVSARQVDNGSSWECKHRCPELNACISPGLYCDGTANCPSGFDEDNPDCGVTTKLLSVLTPGRVIIVSTSSAVLLAFLCLVALLCTCRRPSLPKRRKDQLLASNSSTLSS